MDVLYAIQKDLLENPEKGDVIKGTKGARKARIGDKSQKRGKSGSYRYIYAYFSEADRIYLILFYSKQSQDTLDDEETKVVAAFMEQTKKNLKGG